MMMEISAVHNNDPLVKEVRLMQCTCILESVSVLSNLPELEILSRFKMILDKEQSSWNKEVRVLDGEDILNDIFNEKDN